MDKIDELFNDGIQSHGASWLIQDIGLNGVIVNSQYMVNSSRNIEIKNIQLIVNNT